VPSALIEHRVKDVGGRLAYLQELRDGLRFVRNNALVLSMVLVATVDELPDVPLLTVVLPVYARDNYGSAASFGGIVGALAAGAFLGTLVFGAVGRRLPRRLTFIVSFVVSPMIITSRCLRRPLFPRWWRRQ
jgi:MFS family permease